MYSLKHSKEFELPIVGFKAWLGGTGNVNKIGLSFQQWDLKFYFDGGTTKDLIV